MQGGGGLLLGGAKIPPLLLYTADGQKNYRGYEKSGLVTADGQKIIGAIKRPIT